MVEAARWYDGWDDSDVQIAYVLINSFANGMMSVGRFQNHRDALIEEVERKRNPIVPDDFTGVEGAGSW